MITTIASPGIASSPTHFLALLLLLPLLSLIPGPADAATQIYRTVDESGTVVFSDVPPPPNRGGEAVELRAPNTFAPAATREGGLSVEEWLAGRDRQTDAEAADARYQSLRVAYPPHDANIRENAGNVMVTAEIQPDLKPGHQLQLYLDGNLMQAASTPQIQLQNVDRGTHTLELRVVDDRGEILMASDPSVFHLQRRSVILQPPPARRAP